MALYVEFIGTARRSAVWRISQLAREVRVLVSPDQIERLDDAHACREVPRNPCKDLILLGSLTWSKISARARSELAGAEG